MMITRAPEQFLGPPWGGRDLPLRRNVPGWTVIALDQGVGR
jgi:hypothetical protein